MQSESVTKKPLANYWMHNGMLQVADAKMSKSLKNFFSVKDIAAQVQDPGGYVSICSIPITADRSFTARARSTRRPSSLKRIQNAYTELKDYAPTATGNYDAEDLAQKTRSEFTEQMDDDFNTRGAHRRDLRCRPRVEQADGP